eukprot:CAMPEP_0202889710 /NCGR_PEP_ID=MMETSP1392-20130828/299_1 /ASSEMBLY_ACC=CAM_ASM_000868 /TAXON_ID=225041 /ORGANISM="Chlamydomonas chlamydogama, Strain SAG 11-48b" /LENGTH=260 /DNA_ID=CAMNT_0049573105 /DNA_START=66 /DNA_END=848 /DNA_ORIENTATION=+
MSLSLLSKPSVGVCARPARAARSVRVMASVPENVAEARAWIGNWKDKQAASANRPSWFPGTTLPSHLNGTLPGDFGFDPLGLGTDSERLNWYVQAELQNGRWAMLAVAGILFPELASNIGISWPGAGVKWFEVPDFKFYAPASTLSVVAAFLFHWVEIRRYQDIVNPGSVNQDPIFSNNKLPDNNTPGYPGGIFDPFGWSKGDLATLKVKEIKNGRLAMLAFAGFGAQAYTTGLTPLAALSKHLADPWANTVWSLDLARL